MSIPLLDGGMLRTHSVKVHLLEGNFISTNLLTSPILWEPILVAGVPCLTMSLGFLSYHHFLTKLSCRESGAYLMIEYVKVMELSKGHNILIFSSDITVAIKVM